MTKLDLQKELLEKVKPGTKPSDIKRQVKKSLDEGYESDKSNKSIPVAPPLPNQDLLNQITSLKNQLQVYQDFKEADLKIKEKYKQEIKDLQAKIKEKDKTITNLQNQAKPTTKATTTQATQTERTFEIKNYSCQICFENKKNPSQLLRVKGLGGERNKKI